MCIMEALYIPVKKLLPRLKFLKIMSNFRVNVTESKLMEQGERTCPRNDHVKYEGPV